MVRNANIAKSDETHEANKKPEIGEIINRVVDTYIQSSPVIACLCSLFIVEFKITGKNIHRVETIKTHRQNNFY